MPTISLDAALDRVTNMALNWEQRCKNAVARVHTLLSDPQYAAHHPIRENALNSPATFEIANVFTLTCVPHREAVIDSIVLLSLEGEESIERPKSWIERRSSAVAAVLQSVFSWRTLYLRSTWHPQ